MVIENSVGAPNKLLAVLRRHFASKNTICLKFYCVEKICDLLLQIIAICYVYVYVQCSKLQFLFVNEQKQLARVLPESSAVICARFGRVSATLRLHYNKLLSFFGVWGGFFKKSPTIPAQTNSPINPKLSALIFLWYLQKEKKGGKIGAYRFLFGGMKK